MSLSLILILVNESLQIFQLSLRLAIIFRKSRYYDVIVEKCELKRIARKTICRWVEIPQKCLFNQELVGNERSTGLSRYN